MLFSEKQAAVLRSENSQDETRQERRNKTRLEKERVL